MKKLWWALFIFVQCSLAAASDWEDDQIRVVQTHTYEGLSSYEQIKEEQRTKVIVKNVLKMFKEGLPSLNPGKITLYPHVWSEKLNAYYTPSKNSLTFNVCQREGKWIRAGQSIDIVAHETGHLVSHAINRRMCRPCRNQTGSFEESFGDITSFLFKLWHPELRKAAIRNFNNSDDCLGSDIGTCIRPLHHSQTLKNSSSCEIHDLSWAFTGAVYDTIKSCFMPQKRCAYHLAGDFRDILVQSVLHMKLPQPSFSDMALKMLSFSSPYQNILGNHFISRGILSLRPVDGYYLYVKGPYEGICDQRIVKKRSPQKVSQDSCVVM